VVTVYDVGETGGIAYIAMEFLEGRSLRQVLDSGEPLPLDSVVNIAAQIADALDYAQRFGIVHRDIKPANIMIAPSGLAKLTDFGVAYMPSSSMTQTGTVLGSPKYLSPEQVLGLPVDGRADIFALGVVLYEMLARTTPFEKPDITVFSLMQAICMQPVQRVTEVTRDIPPAFDTILTRALGKRPEERYQRAGEFANDLRNYKQHVLAATDQTVMAAPLSAAEKTMLTRATTLPEPTPLPSRPLSDDPEMRKHMDRLAADLETFSVNFDQESRKIEEKAKEIWAEREQAEREAMEDAEAEKDPDADKPKSTIVRMLQEQAKSREQLESTATIESATALHGKLRKAHLYLKQFVKEFNATKPAFAGKMSMNFVGDLPSVTIGEGDVDILTTRISGKEVIDTITLTYRMMSNEKIRATLSKDEARLLKAQLERAEIKCEEKEMGGMFQKDPRIAITADCRFAARVKIRGDYNGQVLDFLCQNVGGIGASRYRIPANRFDDKAIEEFGKRLLGQPNGFAELKLPD
jgi:serine/threonine protein kinase